ncbi:MAG: 16S rRNA (guanine(966)-N(2))-methyltransferase RsmD [bacterium]|nr:16S rRNA (guanine(966)-N(2))-methyltransferase RsmD [bacterium]
MKVISGTLKGRVVEGFSLKETRPTMDRVKESLFASIQNYVPNSTVLDLFAGSGNLGIESISNGTSKVFFNDKSKDACKVIDNNISKFGIKDKSIIMNYDYMKCLKVLKEENQTFDIIFLDPPYKMEILNEVIEFIINNNLINNGGIIVCEISNYYLKNYEMLKIIKKKKYGDKEIVILKK